MNGRVLLGVGSLGILMGIASVLGAVRAGQEVWVWLVFGIGSAFLVARLAPRQFLLHGLIAGFICGTLSTVIQSIFLGSYLSHNPAAAVSIRRMPDVVPPQIFILISAPFIGLIMGMVLGVLSWIVGSITRRKGATSAI